MDARPPGQTELFREAVLEVYVWRDERKPDAVETAVLLNLPAVVIAPRPPRRKAAGTQPILEMRKCVDEPRATVHVGLRNGGQLHAKFRQLRMSNRPHKGVELVRDFPRGWLQQRRADLDDLHFFAGYGAHVVAGSLEVENQVAPHESVLLQSAAAGAPRSAGRMRMRPGRRTARAIASSNRR